MMYHCFSHSIVQQIQQPKLSWNDYFTGTVSPTITPGQYSSTQTPTSSNVYIFGCFFINCTSSSGGGAVYCSSTAKYVLVESTTFLTCRSNGDGGAIASYNTENVFNRVCGNDCCTLGASYGQFTHKDTSGSATSKNYINYSSIVRCVNQVSSSYETLRHCSGKLLYSSNNISMNKCYYRPGFICHPTSDSNSFTGSLLYSTFANNSALSDNCIMFNRGGAKYEIISCNILRNTQVNLGSTGTIHTTGILMIDDSCILENTATYIFYSSSSSYPITLYKCTVDKTGNNGYLTTQRTVDKSFILALNHISTENCHSEYDSAGSLTVFQYNSHCDKVFSCHCKAKLSDFFSFSWGIIVLFIHSDSYVDFCDVF
jgi:hypothetical protein